MIFLISPQIEKIFQVELKINEQFKTCPAKNAILSFLFDYLIECELMAWFKVRQAREDVLHAESRAWTEVDMSNGWTSKKLIRPGPGPYR